jgi:hypothetical protein
MGSNYRAVALNRRNSILNKIIHIYNKTKNGPVTDHPALPIIHQGLFSNGFILNAFCAKWRLKTQDNAKKAKLITGNTF